MTEYCGSHSHEHHHEGSCGCGSDCSCGCGSKTHEHKDSGCSCNCAEKFLDLADEAWKELLKERIKAKILAKKGEHIEKLAELVAKANGEKWKHMISAKTKAHEFKDELKDFFKAGE